AAAPPAPPVPAPTVAAPAFSDQDFVNRAAAGTALEIETGRLAGMAAGSRAVRVFGRHIAFEHSRLNAQVMALAQREGMVPTAAGRPPGAPGCRSARAGAGICPTRASHAEARARNSPPGRVFLHRLSIGAGTRSTELPPTTARLAVRIDGRSVKILVRKLVE